MEQEVKKTINLLEIIFVSTIICLTQASCIVFGFDDDTNPFSKDNSKPYLKVANTHDLPITKVSIKFIERLYYYDEYIFDGLNIPKGKSETLPLETLDKPYNAEVIVFFGDMYSYKEFSFNNGKTTTAILNVNGILE
jgi:hypothetical protein